jgi:glycerophosphoryl diester phosphodiesterase
VTLVYAHRGASAVAPENTLAAFRAAVALGADGVELDVRRTADGALAVHHDPYLPDGRPLVGLASGELPPTVPLVGDAVDACDGLVVNIEIKNLPGEPDFDPAEAAAEAVAALVAERRLHDRVLVSSFNPSTVGRLRQLDPAVPTALLALVAPDVDDARRLVEEARRGGHRAVHPHFVGVTPQLVELCAGAGLALNTWTVDEPDLLARLGALGVDGLITDVPDVALRVLGRSGPPAAGPRARDGRRAR